MVGDQGFEQDVGVLPLQFDVVLHRLEHEFGARADLDHLDYTLARRTDAEGARALAGQRATEVLTRRIGQRSLGRTNRGARYLGDG